MPAFGVCRAEILRRFLFSCDINDGTDSVNWLCEVRVGIEPRIDERYGDAAPGEPWICIETKRCGKQRKRVPDALTEQCSVRHGGEMLLEGTKLIQVEASLTQSVALIPFGVERSESRKYLCFPGEVEPMEQRWNMLIANRAAKDAHRSAGRYKWWYCSRHQEKSCVMNLRLAIGRMVST